MGSVSEANALVPDPNVAVPEGTLPASGVAGEALQEAEPKSLETVDAGNPPEPGTGGDTEPAAKRQKEEQCERLVTKLEQGFEVSQTALVAVKDYLVLHQKLAQDVSTLATEYGYDRCSNKYMLA